MHNRNYWDPQADEDEDTRRDDRDYPYRAYRRDDRSLSGGHAASRQQADYYQGRQDPYGRRDRDADDGRFGERSDSRYRNENTYRHDSYRHENSARLNHARNDWSSQAGQSRFYPSYNSMREDSRDSRSRERWPEMRGVYQEQAWTRNPDDGNLYGYEYTTRLGPDSDPWRQRDRSRWDRSSSESYGTSGLGQTGHYGKGPKGYIRSNERIREDVCDRLSDDDEVDASDISVSVKDGEVTLEGTVNDRRSKRRAEDIAEAVSGVRDVSNKLRTQKSFMREIGDKLAGDDPGEHSGHSGSGTRNSPASASRIAPSH